MAVTRLGQIGVGVDAYAAFAFAGKTSRSITRLGQIGIGVTPYGLFEAKAEFVTPTSISEPHYAVTQAFMDRLAENWTATAVIGLNGVTETPSDNSAFVALEHEIVTALKPSVNTRRFFQDGAVRLCMYVASGTGLSSWLIIAGQLASLFREREFDGVRTFAPSGPLIGDYNEEGNWLELSVLIPYRYQFHLDNEVAPDDDGGVPDVEPPDPSDDDILTDESDIPLLDEVGAGEYLRAG